MQVNNIQSHPSINFKRTLVQWDLNLAWLPSTLVVGNSWKDNSAYVNFIKERQFVKRIYQGSEIDERKQIAIVLVVRHCDLNFPRIPFPYIFLYTYLEIESFN